MTARPFGLSPEQTRVLGALAEKSATTPEAYPLSSNAVRAACNQRSSRDPVVAYDEETVKAAMLALRERELAKTVRGAGSRVFKHAHTLDRLELTEPEVAVLAVLMLRGPQTIGELKTRSERQHAFTALEETHAVLEAMLTRPEPLVEQLAREPGQKEARWRHLLETEPDFVDTARAGTPAQAASTEKPAVEEYALPQSGSDAPADDPARESRSERPLDPSLAGEAAARADAMEEIARRLDALERGLAELKRTLDAG